MDIQYEIISVDERLASIVVRYFNQAHLDGIILNIDLPIDENSLVPEGEDLDFLIMHHAPRFQLNRAAMMPVNMSAISALVVAPNVCPNTEQPSQSGLSDF